MSEKKTFQISESVRVASDWIGGYYPTETYARFNGLYLHTIAACRGLITWNTTSDLSGELSELIDNFAYDREALTAKIGEYFDEINNPELFSERGYNYIYTIHHFTGTSPSEWHTAIVYAKDALVPTKYFDGAIKQLNAFYNGEVYNVTVENAKVFTAEDGETITQWITDQEYDFTEIVEDGFELNADFVKEWLGLEVQA